MCGPKFCSMHISRQLAEGIGALTSAAATAD
jgi:hypothetical protein